MDMIFLIIFMAFLIMLGVFIQKWIRKHGFRYPEETEKETLKEQMDDSFWGMMICLVVMTVSSLLLYF